MCLCSLMQNLCLVCYGLRFCDCKIFDSGQILVEAGVGLCVGGKGHGWGRAMGIAKFLV